MITKQFVEKQIAIEKEPKREYKEIKDKDKDKEKEKEKEKETHKELHKEIIKEIQVEKPREVLQPFQDPGGPVEEARQLQEPLKIVEHKPAPEKALYKEHKIEKVEIKEYKTEKHEFKEHKFEKAEIKEVEKVLFDGKGVYEGPLGTGQGGGDPYAQRIAALEAVVTQLLHFIPAELRPDLSQGALKQEPDAPKHGAAEASGSSPSKEGKK
jgi:hypothetical protein